MFTALLFFKVRRATGVEYERNKSLWSQEALASLPKDETGTRGLGVFEHNDITTWNDLAGVCLS